MMGMIGTMAETPPTPLSQAIAMGTPREGGLFRPNAIPTIDPDEADRAESLAAIAKLILAPFFDGDPLADQLDAICEETFTFPAPLVAPDEGNHHYLELFHGPTGAFKDFGARFLMACLDRLPATSGLRTVLVATSGDTGGAVGQAAEGRQGLQAVILYPKGRVSKFQEKQLCCWGTPVKAIRVAGDFDDCQALVKAAFADPELREKHGLTSANSINLGRLLPQMVYWADAALRLFKEKGKPPGLVIPTGNLGNVVAALYARAMGLPIGPVVIATNANATLADWHQKGTFSPRPSVQTLANAMDVGNPSNFDRLAALPQEQSDVSVALVDDATIKKAIGLENRLTGYEICPHTATGMVAYSRLRSKERRARPWIIGATAHPYKFADVVEPVIGDKIVPPPALANVLKRKGNKKDLATLSLDSLAKHLAG